MVDVWLVLAFGVIAFVYASVGFGGGSSYKAALAIYGFDAMVVRSVGLVCNISVVTTGMYLYYRAGHLKWKQSWPLLIGSIPAAFLGGTVRLSEGVYFLLLGLTLLAAALLMWQQRKGKDVPEYMLKEAQRLWTSLGLGMGIGFLAGLVGIGGGIFLAPVLHLLRWGAPKVIAATCSAFIFFNSVAGLIGQFTQTEFSFDLKIALPLVFVVSIAGRIGSRVGIEQLPQATVRRWTAVLIALVGARLVWTYGSVVLAFL